MVPLTVNPSGQLEKHRPLCEYRPSLHFVQKFRLKHASQFSILHSVIKKDNNSYILNLSTHFFNNSAFDAEQVDRHSYTFLQFLTQKLVRSRMSGLSYGFLTLLSYYKPAVFDQTYKLPQIRGNCGFWQNENQTPSKQNRIHFPTHNPFTIIIIISF